MSLLELLAVLQTADGNLREVNMFDRNTFEPMPTNGMSYEEACQLIYNKGKEMNELNQEILEMADAPEAVEPVSRSEGDQEARQEGEVTREVSEDQ